MNHGIGWEKKAHAAARFDGTDQSCSAAFTDICDPLSLLSAPSENRDFSSSCLRSINLSRAKRELSQLNKQTSPLLKLLCLRRVALTATQTPKRTGMHCSCVCVCTSLDWPDKGALICLYFANQVPTAPRFRCAFFVEWLLSHLNQVCFRLLIN